MAMAFMEVEGDLHNKRLCYGKLMNGQREREREGEKNGNSNLNHHAWFLPFVAHKIPFDLHLHKVSTRETRHFQVYMYETFWKV